MPSCKDYFPQEHGVTQSLLSAFVDCRQRAAFRLEGWRRTDTKAALSFGTLIHGVLHAIYARVRDAGGTPTTDQIIQWGKTYINDEAAKAIKEGKPLEMVEEHAAKAISLLRGYAIAYHEVDFNPAKTRWVSLEENFSELVSVPAYYHNEALYQNIRLVGRWDGLKRNSKNELWLFETKTASRISEDALNDALTFNFQNLFYLLAAEAKMGEPVKGVEYNIVRVPQLRLKKNETHVEFRKRITNDILERPEHYYHRYEIRYPKSTLKDFKTQLRAKYWDFLKWVAKEGPTYRNEAACQKRWNCEYLPACASGKMAGFAQYGEEIFPELAT